MDISINIVTGGSSGSEPTDANLQWTYEATDDDDLKAKRAKFEAVIDKFIDKHGKENFRTDDDNNILYYMSADTSPWEIEMKIADIAVAYGDDAHKSYFEYLEVKGCELNGCWPETVKRSSYYEWPVI